MCSAKTTGIAPAPDHLFGTLLHVHTRCIRLQEEKMRLALDFIMLWGACGRRSPQLWKVVEVAAVGGLCSWAKPGELGTTEDT